MVLRTTAPPTQPTASDNVALGWFALAYWQERVRWWEAAFVVLGATAALLRAGNARLLALALVAPLGGQLSDLRGEQLPSELRELNANVLVLHAESADLVSQVRASSDWRVVYDAANAVVAERATP